MHNDAITTWHPTRYDLESSELARFIQFLGAENFDGLRAIALNDSDRYWQAVSDYCSVTWKSLPSACLDANSPHEFPRWFPGGKLNWVNSILQWSRRPETAARPAIIAESENGSVATVSFEQLDQQVRSFAAALRELGVRRGDRVGLMMENGIEASVSLLAIISLGAIVAPLFSGFGVEPIVARLSSAEATVIIASDGFNRRGKRINIESIVRDAWSQLPSVERIIWKSDNPAIARSERESLWQAVLDQATVSDFTPVIVDPNDPFMVIYTSGTTGKPKGIVHTHGSFPIKIAHDAVVHFDIRPGDVFCWPADMGWIAGTLVMSCALLRGATLVCYDGAPNFPDWSRMSRLIERHRITHFGSAPTLIRGLASHEFEALQGDVSSVRLLITAGEAIDREHFCWFQAHFSDSRPLINYTGGTEASGALLSSVIVKPIVPAGFNSVSPGVDLDLVGAGGNPVEVDEVGELVIRRPFLGMTQSFWRDDERYLETYWQALPGMWLHGDLASRNVDGHYFMAGRSDDTIKLAGKRLGPAEVEDVALELAEVSEAAAIGVNDESKGQRLVMFVVPCSEQTVDAVALSALVTRHIDEKLGRPFKPSDVHVVSQLPKTRSSKIMRRVIRAVYCGLPPGDLSSLDNVEAIEVIRAVSPAAQPPPSTLS